MKTSAALKNATNCRVFHDPHSLVVLIFLQHKKCTFVTILFRLCWAVLQPDGANKSTFPKSTSILRLVTNILEDAFELIFRGQTRRSSTGTLISWTSGSRRISLILPHERPRRRIRVYQLCALIEIVTETAIVSVRTLPVDFPLPTIT